MRTSIATVCLSGTLTEKLHACAEAGFDGVEIFEPDLVASPASPEEIAALARRLGLSLDLYQPFRDAEGVSEDALPRGAAPGPGEVRADATAWRRHACWSAATSRTATVDDDAVSAAQLRRLGDVAAAYGVRLAFEALAWGRFVDDYRRAWQIVELADHPAVGVCLDSFHILSQRPRPCRDRGDPWRQDLLPPARRRTRAHDGRAVVEPPPPAVPGRGHLRPGDVHRPRPARPATTGPLSLEVFNDTFRQTDVLRTAQQAKRSLTWLEDQVARLPAADTVRTDPPGRLPDVDQPAAFDFVEVKAEDAGEVDVLLRQLGFTFRGHHRTQAGPAVDPGPRPGGLQRAAGPGVGADAGGGGLPSRRPGGLGGPRARPRCAVGLPAYPSPTSRTCPRSGHRTAPRSSSPDIARDDAAWVPEFEGGERALG